MKVALCQFNSVVGDLTGNCKKMRKMYKQAVEQSAELIVFPEAAVCGYPPEGLLYNLDFREDTGKAVKDFASDCPEKMIIAGFVESEESKIYNSAAVIEQGKVKSVYHKSRLPNYGFFDEQRYFSAGNQPMVVEKDGLRIAVTICRDIWEIEWLSEFLTGQGRIDVILNISASRYYTNKAQARQKVVTDCAKFFNCCLCYCNLVGGQDEIVFDGDSMVVNPAGQIVLKGKSFEEDLLIADITRDANKIEIKTPSRQARKQTSLTEQLYHALVLGTRDYTRKNGFEKVLLGISGGIDSSVTAVIAADAVGAKNVTGVTMPTRFNSPETMRDAEKVAHKLKINLHSIRIDKVLDEFDKMLTKIPAWDSCGIAYENLQARIRGIVLMSLSNQSGALVLTSGNKSEMAVGYTTLYGDMAGGFAVLKDVKKTMVYRLAEFINKKTQTPVIPTSVIERPPSAELSPNQKDSDTLGEYDLLDKVLEQYLEQGKSATQILKTPLPGKAVCRTIAMVDKNEYKRRQAPPGIKISPETFGKEHRFPITNHYQPSPEQS